MGKGYGERRNGTKGMGRINERNEGVKERR
jgi:hypothetical protein